MSGVVEVLASIEERKDIIDLSLDVENTECRGLVVKKNVYYTGLWSVFER